MNFINQPIVETLPVILNKLCQFFIWLFTFTNDPNDKWDFYKALIICILCLPIYDIYLIFTYSKNIFRNFIGVITANIIVIVSAVLFIEFAF